MNYNCSFKSVNCTPRRSRRGSASRRLIDSGQRLVVVAKRFVGCRSIGAMFSVMAANGTASAVEVRSRCGDRSVRTGRDFTIGATRQWQRAKCARYQPSLRKSLCSCYRTDGFIICSLVTMFLSLDGRGRPSAGMLDGGLRELTSRGNRR